MMLKERMPMLLKMHQEDLATLRANAADPAKDGNGCSSSSVMGALRFIGVAEFVVSANVSLFREYLSDAAKIRLRLFERREQGAPIDDSYVAMISYQELFDALAAGDFNTADQLAKRMGGRPEIEARYDHPFDRCLGYTLKAFVLRTRIEMAIWASKLSDICQSHCKGDFVGYSQVFNGILSEDESAVNKGLSVLAMGHKNQTKRGGVFEDLEDEALCVWGVGIANLARHDGLAVQGVPPLIPSKLLVVAGPPVISTADP